jgi:hypothetical protein
MSKKIGEELDSDIHFEMLNSFTLFIEHFSPVLDTATRYHDNIQAEKLISDDVAIIEKEKLAHELVNNLNSMVPIFMNIALIENKLEKYNK